MTPTRGHGVAGRSVRTTSLVAGQQGARFHREPDPRVKRRMIAAIAWSACLAGALLGIVGLKAEHVRSSYRLDALRASRGQLQEANRRLGVELASLGSLGRIESRARAELGMVRPGRDQVLAAREFAPAGAGSGMSERRTAAAGRPSDSGGGLR